MNAYSFISKKNLIEFTCIVTTRSSTTTSFVKKSAPIVAKMDRVVIAIEFTMKFDAYQIMN